MAGKHGGGAEAHAQREAARQALAEPEPASIPVLSM
jgi:hypothetical protein